MKVSLEDKDEDYTPSDGFDDSESEVKVVTYTPLEKRVRIPNKNNDVSSVEESSSYKVKPKGKGKKIILSDSDMGGELPPQNSQNQELELMDLVSQDLQEKPEMMLDILGTM